MAKKKFRFDIDFIEFSFLVEACIPPRPIARSMFWGDTIDKHYHVLTKEERTHLFTWINKCYGMEEGLKNNEKDCILFNKRFDPDNQYLLHLNSGETLEAFKWGEKYHVSLEVSANEYYVKEICKM